MLRLVNWVVGVPEACTLGVEDDLVPALWWQGLEKSAVVKVVVPVMDVVRGVCRRKGPVPSYRFFWEVHFSLGPWVILAQPAKVSELPMVSYSKWPCTVAAWLSAGDHGCQGSASWIRGVH